MVENGDDEPADLRNVVSGSGHRVIVVDNAGHRFR